MRLFTAVEIGAQVQASATRVIADLKLRTAHAAPRARVSWVRPEQLHLTVCFLGQVQPDLSPRILAAMEPPLGVASFELTISGTESFPARRPPRVIWAGITVGLEQLRALEQEVRRRLGAFLPAGDDRNYHPHLTLGRVKHPAGLRPAVLLSGLEQAVFGAVHVKAVTLFESRLSSTGPTYTALGHTPLARTP